MFGYRTEWLDRAPPGAVASFAGVGNPHVRSRLTSGEAVLDLGSGAGLDSIIAGWQVGSDGQVTGVDLNPEMLGKARRHAADAGLEHLEFCEGRMEDLPLPDESVDVALSNGVITHAASKRTTTSTTSRRSRTTTTRGASPRWIPTTGPASTPTTVSTS